MLVDPEAEGAGLLLVDEALAWLPAGDARPPRERDRIEMQAIVDPRPDLHRDGLARQDLEAELGGRDRLEVAGIRKEVENLAEGASEGHVGQDPVVHEPLEGLS